MPVTNHEVMIDDSEFMLTKTDLKGVINFANQDLIKTSGYESNNLVRREWWWLGRVLNLHFLIKKANWPWLKPLISMKAASAKLKY